MPKVWPMHVHTQRRHMCCLCLSQRSQNNLRDMVLVADKRGMVLMPNTRDTSTAVERKPSPFRVQYTWCVIRVAYLVFHLIAVSSSGNQKVLRTEFSPLMFFGALAASEVVVVEVPWDKAMQKLPLPFSRPQYGTWENVITVWFCMNKLALFKIRKDLHVINKHPVHGHNHTRKYCENVVLTTQNNTPFMCWKTGRSTNKGVESIPNKNRKEKYDTFYTVQQLKMGSNSPWQPFISHAFNCLVLYFDKTVVCQAARWYI